jgi:RNA polymerase sigma-70 factor, ECF subfamily
MSEFAVNDRELILHLQSGDLEALGELYDRYRMQIFRTAMAITRDADAAEDILQECFLRVHHYADRINVDLPLAPWLYRVTVNLSYTWSKRNKRYWTSIEALIDRLISPAKHGPESCAEDSELRDNVQRAINGLPFNQRVVVILHYLQGLNLKEIAEIVECPVGTVKSRLFHARLTLKEKLGHEAILISDVAHGYV